MRPPARFGGLVFDGDLVAEFSEKPQVGEGWINGGFFVLEPEVLDYIDADDTIFERSPLERLASDGQLVAYRHEGFWQCMDTLRDVRLLNSLCDGKLPPWDPAFQRDGRVVTDHDFWRERRVFVTGATGIVGSWLVRELLAHGAHVAVLVRDADPQSELLRSGDLQRCTVFNGTVEDLWTLERAISLHEAEYVFHLAAQTIVGVAHRNPFTTFETNVRGTYNLLEACRIHGSLVRGVIVASSDKAYGEVDALPYVETMPLRGPTPVRGLEELHGSHRHVVLPQLRRAGHDRALRQHLRRRRPELEPHRARDDPRVAARRAPDAAQRRHVPSRLHLREGRRARVHAARRALVRTGRPRRGIQLQRRIAARGARHRQRDSAARWVPTSSPTSATSRTGEIRDQYLSAAKARDTPELASDVRPGCRASSETIAWYRALLA